MAVRRKCAALQARDGCAGHAVLRVANSHMCRRGAAVQGDPERADQGQGAQGARRRGRGAPGGSLGADRDNCRGADRYRGEAAALQEGSGPLARRAGQRTLRN